LQHDLYERRFKVFDATRHLLASQSAPADRDFPREDLAKFVSDTADAIFLFDDEIAEYLEEIRARAVRLQAITESLPEGERTVNEARRHRVWFDDKLIGLPHKFKPFFKLDNRRREAGGWQAMAAWFRRHILRRPGS
jgi:hypothetical protein